ncbi:hypothetical protein KCU98_g4597, partial [Aureobasidium melanogenum]
MGLADYLAQNYLSADKSSKGKKRKRKNAEDAGLIITDDDVSGLSKSRNGDDDDDIPMIVPGGANISKQTTTWKTYGKAAPTNNEQAAADAILADAAAETQARNAEDEDAPAVVG